MTVDPQNPSSNGQDTTVYEVFYLNGTSEEVVGIDNVRAHLLDPSQRDASTKTGSELDDFQAGHWSPKREPAVE